MSYFVVRVVSVQDRKERCSKSKENVINKFNVFDVEYGILFTGKTGFFNNGYFQRTKLNPLFQLML